MCVFLSSRSYKMFLVFSVLALSVLGGCGESDEPLTCGTGDARCGVQNNDEGESWPTWTLEDIQPKSTRHTQAYGLDAFEGKTVVLAFLVGWCPYCRAQAIKLEQLQGELGDDVQIVIVHGADANNEKDQKALLYLYEADGSIKEDEQGMPVSRCTMPVFQDTEAVDAWGLHGGGKDDFFIYTPSGKLSQRFPSAAGMNLAKDEKYKQLKDAIVSAGQ